MLRVFVAAVGANQQPAAVVQPGEGAFDDPTVTAEPGAVFGLTARDQRFDAAPPDEATVLVMVVAAVGDDGVGATPRPTDASANGRHGVEQHEQLGDVVAVAAGQRPRRAAARCRLRGDAACCRGGPGRPDWTCLRAPFFACT